MRLHGSEREPAVHRPLHKHRVTLGLLSALLFLLPAWAHHTSAMFDLKKSLTLTGTVKAFQWTNPHCWIQLQVDGTGNATEWSIEMGAPMDLFRNGWKPGTLKPADAITVTIHPTRDGKPAGLFVSATRVDGQPLGKQQ